MYGCLFASLQKWIGLWNVIYNNDMQNITPPDMSAQQGQFSEVVFIMEILRINFLRRTFPYIDYIKKINTHM